MKYATISLLASATAAQNVVEIGINRIKPGQFKGLTKRASYLETLANNITGGGYYADITVGTPGQPQTLVLDTGSSDVWVVAYNADLCTSERMQVYYGDSCGDTYNPSNSETYQIVDRRGFNIQYLDGSDSSGDYISDDVSIAGTTIKSLQIGLATQTVRGTGIMGVGFSNHVAADVPYPNIIDELVNQSIISTKAYSLYLNDRRSDSGTILFGGIDTDKFVGPLNIVPIIRDASTNTISTFTVAMSGLNVTFANGTGDSTIDLPDTEVPALLDSGTTLSYIPESMANALFDAVGAYTDLRTTGLTFIDCSFLSGADAGFTMNFAFSSDSGSAVTIGVPVEEMVLDVFDGYESSIPSNVPFADACLFGMQSTGSFGSTASGLAEANFVLLGDTFLRSAYVVYDLTHKQIGLAPANLNSTSSSVVEFQATDTAIPAVTGVKAQSGAGTGSPTASGDGSSGTVTVTASPQNAASFSGRTPGLEGLVVMAVAGAFALLGGMMVVL